MPLALRVRPRQPERGNCRGLGRGDHAIQGKESRAPWPLLGVSVCFHCTPSASAAHPPPALSHYARAAKLTAHESVAEPERGVMTVGHSGALSHLKINRNTL